MLTIDELELAVWPLWAFLPNLRDPWVVGSGVFLKIQGEHLFLTAGHVIEHFSEYLIGVSGIGQLIQLKGHRFANPKSVQDSLLHDFGGIFLSSETIASLDPRIRFLTFEDIDCRGSTHPDTPVLIAGFPSCKAVAKETWVLPKCLHANVSTAKEPRYVGQLSPSEHLVCEFSLRGWRCHETDKIITLCDPHGLSGGGIFTRVKLDDSEGFMLSGITAVHDPTKHILWGNRVDFILSAIAHHFGERWGKLEKCPRRN